MQERLNEALEMVPIGASASADALHFGIFFQANETDAHR